MDYIQNFLAYWVIVFVYICIIWFISKEKIIKLFTRCLPLGILFQLVYWLIRFRIAIDIDSPFAIGQRGIYGIYAKLYFVIALSLFIIFVARIVKGIFTDRIRLMTYLPFFLLFLYFLYSLSCYAKYTLLCLSLAIFAFTYVIKAEQNFVVAAKRKIRQCLNIFLSKEYLLMIAIFFIAFVVRYLFSIRLLSLTGENFIRASDDGLTYAPYAVMWAHRKIPEGGLYWGGYGYWVFLGTIYRFFGDYNHHMMVLMQSILGGLVPVCTFYIAKRIFNKYVAIMAGILTALDMNLIFLSVVIGMEALFIPMMSLGFLLVILYFQKARKAKLLYAVFIGMFLGFTNVVRGEILLLPFIIGTLAIIFLRKYIGTKRVVVACLALLIGFSMPLILHATRNYVNYDKFTFSTGQAEACFQKGIRGATENYTLNQMGFNPFKSLKRSFTVFLDNPKQVTRLLAMGFCKRTFLFLFIPNFGTFDPVILVNPSSGYVYHYSVYLMVYGYLLLLGGLILAFINGKKIFEKSLLVCYVLYTASIYGMIMVTNARHRGVLMPIFILFFAYGVYIFCRKVKNSYIRP